MAESIRRKVQEIDPSRSVYNVAPLAENISDGYAANRLRTTLLVFFACSAILLASVGLYGTISYVVHVRKPEVGLRLALAARPGRIIPQLLTQILPVAPLVLVAATPPSLP